ncbi:MAG: hypothetical protein ACP6IS_08595 [Candidatus Asgardarchaeia archaeon]
MTITKLLHGVEGFKIKKKRLNRYILLIIFLIAPAVALFSTYFYTPVIATEYLGRFITTKPIPFVVLYDPPGDRSYQMIEEQVTYTFKLSIQAATSGVTGGGEHSVSVTTRWSAKTSDTDENAHIICGRALKITYDLYRITEISPWSKGSIIPYFTTYTYYYVDIIDISDAYEDVYDSFAYYAQHGVYVEDKTGTKGVYWRNIHVGNNATVTYSVEYDISLGTNFGFEIEITLPIVNLQTKFSVTFTFERSVTYTVTVVFHDLGGLIDCSMNSDHNIYMPNENGFQIEYWTFWFGPKWY